MALRRGKKGPSIWGHRPFLVNKSARRRNWANLVRYPWTIDKSHRTKGASHFTTKKLIKDQFGVMLLHKSWVNLGNSVDSAHPR